MTATAMNPSGNPSDTPSGPAAPASTSSAPSRREVEITAAAAAEIKNTQIVEELNLPPVKIHCSVLAEDAIKAAIEDYKKKRR